MACQLPTPHHRQYVTFTILQTAHPLTTLDIYPSYCIQTNCSKSQHVFDNNEDDNDELDGIIWNVGNYFKGKHLMLDGLETEVGKQVNATTALL